MIIFDGFLAGVLCGVSGLTLLLMVLSYLSYQKQLKAKEKMVDFINSLDDAAKTVIMKGDNNIDESND